MEQRDFCRCVENGWRWNTIPFVVVLNFSVMYTGQYNTIYTDATETLRTHSSISRDSYFVYTLVLCSEVNY